MAGNKLNYCPFDIISKDVFCLAFYFEWKYFVLIDHILSETICLYRWTDNGWKGGKNNVALAHPEEKWCSKFGWIQPSGLGEDSMTDRWTDAQKKKCCSHTPLPWLEMMKQVWLNSDQWFRRRQLDGQMDEQRKHGKIVLLPHNLTMRGKDGASLVEFHPMV